MVYGEWCMYQRNHQYFHTHFFLGQGVDLVRLFLSRVRRLPVRYMEVDHDPEVLYDRMPNVYFPIGRFE